MNGPGTVILIRRSVSERRNSTSRTSTGPRAADRADDARDRVLVAGAVERDPGLVQVDALERGREAVRVGLAPHLAVGDHVDSGPLHVLDREPGRVVLRLLELLLGNAPELTRAHARRQPVREPLPVDQPVRLRVAPDDGREERLVSVERLLQRAPREHAREVLAELGARRRVARRARALGRLLGRVGRVGAGGERLLDRLAREPASGPCSSARRRAEPFERDRGHADGRPVLRAAVELDVATARRPSARGSR